MTRKQTVYRAADDDNVVGSASFAETREAAAKYLDNPGFGGARLWRVEVEIDEQSVLDLTEDGETVLDEMGAGHRGLPADERVPRVAESSDLFRDAGIEWCLVRESFPADTTTWIFVGVVDPDMEEIEKG